MCITWSDSLVIKILISHACQIYGMDIQVYLLYAVWSISYKISLSYICFVTKVAEDFRMNLQLDP